LKNLLRKSQAIVGFVRDMKYIKNKYKKNQKEAIKNYLSSTDIPSLHIGAGGTPLEAQRSPHFSDDPESLRKHAIFA
jgi:hypothetical protein